MSNEKPQSSKQTEHGGQRPLQNDAAKALSGLRPANPEVRKGQRPLQEGHRPAQSEPSASVGPAADSPGSGVPPKPKQ
jgi:hypothetical protein